MIKLTQKQLDKKIELHQKWLNKEKGGKCLDLAGYNLTNITINDINLNYVRFDNTVFKNCIIKGTSLCYTCFLRCRFEGCKISESLFRRATLLITVHDSYFDNIRRECSNLTDSTFSTTKIKDNCFWYTNLSDVSFSLVNFYDNEICASTNIYEVSFFHCTNIPKIPQHLICPPYGSFIGWKKIRNINGDQFLVKLEIPATAKRSSASTRKCRCSKAKVLGFYKTWLPLQPIPLTEVVHLNYYDNKKIVYKVGEMAIPDSFDEDEWSGCSHGIHFFMTPEETIEY